MELIEHDPVALYGCRNLGKGAKLYAQAFTVLAVFRVARTSFRVGVFRISRVRFSIISGVVAIFADEIDPWTVTHTQNVWGLGCEV